MTALGAWAVPDRCYMFPNLSGSVASPGELPTAHSIFSPIIKNLWCGTCSLASHGAGRCLIFFCHACLRPESCKNSNNLFIIKTITTCICACFPSTVVQSFCISIQAKIDNAAECHTLSNVRSLSWRMWSGFKSVQFYSIFFFWGGVVKWPNKILTWLKTSLMRIELYQFLLYFILIAHLIIYRQTSYSLTELCSTQSAIVLGNWFMKCDRKTIIYLQ